MPYTYISMRRDTIHKTAEVFGISRDLPLNYVERDSADKILIDNLTRDKHIVIYGSSKQGKTSLRKYCLQESDYIVIQCSNKWSLSDIHSAILKKAGYEVTQSTTKTVAGKNRITAKLGAAIWGLGSEVSGEKSDETGSSSTKAPLELDPEDVNDIINALRGFSKYIVLEDFHYLTTEAQKDFAVALKAFHEQSKLCFIIVGVWLEENRLTVYNGDLTGRLVSVNADKWTKEELRQVIERGEKFLKIRFSSDFVEALLRECFDSVYLVQEVCFQCCMRSGVYQTQISEREIGKDLDARDLIKSVVNEQSGRYMSFITQFASGFQDTALKMYTWLLLPILVSEVSQLESGLLLNYMRKLIQLNHPQGKELNVGNLTQALQSCASLQVKKDIKPIILDYDQTNLRLNVVDRSFMIWLVNQSRNELLEMADLPNQENLKQLPQPSLGL